MWVLSFSPTQDIEWTMKDHKKYPLRSRSSTTRLPIPREEDMMIWTNLNLGEIMPDVATPLSWSMIKPLAEGIFSSFFGWIGLQVKGYPLIGHVAGRLYFNLNFFLGALRRFPTMGDANLTKVLGGAQGELGDVANITIPEEAIPNLQYSLLNVLMNIPNFIRKFISFLPKNAFRFIEMTETKVKELRKRDISSYTERELLRHLHHIFLSVLRATPGIGFSMEGMFFYGTLEKICKNWLGDSDGILVNRLLAGIEGMDSAIAGLELFHLAEKAKLSPEIEHTLSEGREWHRIRTTIESLQGGEDFITQWDLFMREHGHHTRGELELYNPRWADTPEYILRLIQGYLKAPPSLNPITAQRKAERERKRLEKKCRGKLNNPLKQLLFNFTLHQAQMGSVARENIKSRAVRFWTFMRSTIMELGERLSLRGIIDDSDDIFFLRMRELSTILKNEKKLNVKEIVIERRKEYKKNLSLTPPKVVVGKFDTDNFIPDEVVEKATVLKGLAVSPGTATGPARVILRSSTSESVLPGEILVAPFTDPGWTPYFITASGIVMDMGGILSHGSIIAREYGIPTVVNVGSATKIITTGQIIHVDGTKGIVKILD
jgi:phosphohistidine swiveling domain-containing protein